MTTKTARADAMLRVTRLIKAPRERVFAAWTTPADIMKWLGPDTCQVLSAKVDLRVGGQYRFKVKTEERGELDVTGVYKEIKAPAKLVYTWAGLCSPGLGGEGTLVTVEFLDRSGDTEIQLTHERFPDTEARDQHQYGWNGSLDKLQALLGGEGSCLSAGEFCWNELLTTDVAGATKFYAELFGWQAEEFPGMEYTMFKKEGAKMAGMMLKKHPQAPTQWLSYVAVENVDSSADKAVKLGGKVIVPPFDVPTVGRIAVLHDPQGASIALFQPVKK